MDIVEQEVKFEDWRIEIIANVAELASGTLGESVTPVGSRFLEIFELLVDEARINEDLHPRIGEFLKDELEARALNDLAAPLIRVFKDGASAIGNEPYMRSESWPELQECANRALSVLRPD